MSTEERRIRLREDADHTDYMAWLHEERGEARRGAWLRDIARQQRALAEGARP
jgi:hypothetical protein